MTRCPSCQAENPDRQKFCGECGAPLLGSGPAKEERKVVTVLFADLVGFTGRSEQLDPEDVRGAARAVLRAPARGARALRRHRREVHRRRGDGGLRRADRARGRSRARGSRGARDPRPVRGGRRARARVRIAVNTGEALVALGARPDEGEGMASGDVVNTAARLQSAAPVNGILVGEATYRATSDVDRVPRGRAGRTRRGSRSRCRSGRRVAARSRFGVDVEQRAGDRARRARARARRCSSTRSSAARARALAAARDARRRPRHRQEPARRRALPARRRASRSSSTWRQGRSLPYGEGVSFWALAEIVKAQAGILETDDAEAAAAKLAAAVEAVIADADEREWVERAPAAARRCSPAPPTRRRSSRRGVLRLAALPRGAGGAAPARARLRGPALGRRRRCSTSSITSSDWASERAAARRLHGAARAPRAAARAGAAASATRDGLARAAVRRRRPRGCSRACSSRRCSRPDVQRSCSRAPAGNPLYAEEYVRMLQDRGSSARRRGWRSRADELPLPEKRAGDDRGAPRRAARPRRRSSSRTRPSSARCSGPARSRRWPSATAGVERALHALERKEFVRRERRSAVAGEPSTRSCTCSCATSPTAQIPRAAGPTSTAPLPSGSRRCRLTGPKIARRCSRTITARRIELRDCSRRRRRPAEGAGAGGSRRRIGTRRGPLRLGGRP